MSAPASDPAIAAATVVILRDAPAGWELLLLERHAATAFAGGAMVFPGGRVDPGDAAVAANSALAGGFAGLELVDAAARVAGAREAFEEVGVLLSDGPAIPAAVLAEWQSGLNQGRTVYRDFLADRGHRLDAARLLPFAHWIPPAGAPIARRFDTRFYLARLPAGATVAPDGHEAVAAHWTTPAAALTRADAGDIGLVFPTRRNVERLGQYPTLDGLFAATAARPVVRIEPAIEMRDGAQWLTIPSGCDYPVVAEAMSAVRRE